MPKFEDYELPATEESPTLAAALRQFLPGQSWNDARKLIRSRRVEVNRTLCVDDARRLAAGDAVRVWDQAQPKPPGVNAVQLVFRDEHLVVVDKPAGLLSVRHRAEKQWSDLRKSQQPTLDELVQEILPAPSRGGKSHSPRRRKLSVVQRLDRDTSGLIVFALSPAAEAGLIEQFKAHTVERRYLAIVEGSLKAKTIESQLVRDRGDGIRGSHAEQGQPAITHVRPVEKIGAYSLVECRLETGRTHQIRIHLSEQGNPVCGDAVYRRPLNEPAPPDESGAARQMLHAAELGFLHPVSGEKRAFESAPPEDMQRVLSRLREAAKAL